ncbi:MAG: F0F1 ATP synthase subunit epsilon [Planctomycetota bacterium]|nr:F0F1 ATP synthase subunit epsilon [Planctomycetota bacterium]
MAKKSFVCTVVTPTASLVSGEVFYANVPAWDGQMGFLPGRAPILARLGKGELRLDFADTQKFKGGTASYRIDGGFIKMADDKLVILAEKAEPINA